MLFVRCLIVKRFSFDMILSSVSTWTTSGFAMVYHRRHRRVAAHTMYIHVFFPIPIENHPFPRLREALAKANGSKDRQFGSEDVAHLSNTRPRTSSDCTSVSLCFKKQAAAFAWRKHVIDIYYIFRI